MLVRCRKLNISAQKQRWRLYPVILNLLLSVMINDCLTYRLQRLHPLLDFLEPIWVIIASGDIFRDGQCSRR
jgi:hypothetical protein